jgi:mannose-6-phosphate isomerase-like protein (cupin superfamily)
MDAIRTVKSGERLLAIFVRKGLAVDGAHFVTSPDDSLQLGVFSRPAGYRVAAHRHNDLSAQPRKGAEFLYIEKGKAKVTVFDDAWKVAGEETVSAGDFLLFLDGGHQVEMLEPTRFLEVKQGPYPGDKDAKIFRDAP